MPFRDPVIRNRHIHAAVLDGIKEWRRTALEPFSKEDLARAVVAQLDKAGFKIVCKPRKRRNKNWRIP